jgi:hypothetical protein
VANPDTSPQDVAFKLLIAIAWAEKKQLGQWQATGDESDRKWVLNAYAECLEAALGNRSISRQ